MNGMTSLSAATLCFVSLAAYAAEMSPRHHAPLSAADWLLRVGECEGARKVSSGPACEHPAERCAPITHVTVAVSVNLQPLGIGGSVQFSVSIPVGCDGDSHDRDECSPQEEFTTGAPDEGNVEAIYADECSPKNQTRSSCKAQLIDIPIEVPVPDEIIQAAEDLQQTIEDVLGQLPSWIFGNLPSGWTPPGIPSYKDGKLVFNFVGVSGCAPDANNTSNYPCGSKMVDVRTCD